MGCSTLLNGIVILMSALIVVFFILGYWIGRIIKGTDNEMMNEYNEKMRHSKKLKDTFNENFK